MTDFERLSNRIKDECARDWYMYSRGASCSYVLDEDVRVSLDITRVVELDDGKFHWHINIKLDHQNAFNAGIMARLQYEVRDRCIVTAIKKAEAIADAQVETCRISFVVCKSDWNEV